MLEKHQIQQADDVSNVDVIASWNQAAEDFASLFGAGEFYHTHIIIPCLLDLLGDLRGKTILDLGCGEGHLARAEA
jgi:2-polyprenyl-3-methyl-5-hydroxy-6-metoxy-1,4-benzoquinol methylase